MSAQTIFCLCLGLRGSSPQVLFLVFYIFLLASLFDALTVIILGSILEPFLATLGHVGLSGCRVAHSNPEKVHQTSGVIEHWGF